MEIGRPLDQHILDVLLTIGASGGVPVAPGRVVQVPDHGKKIEVAESIHYRLEVSPQAIYYRLEVYPEADFDLE